MVGSQLAVAALALASAASAAAAALITAGILSIAPVHVVSGPSSCRSSMGKVADSSGATPVSVSSPRRRVATASDAAATSCCDSAMLAVPRCTSSTDAVPPCLRVRATVMFCCDTSRFRRAERSTDSSASSW